MRIQKKLNFSDINGRKNGTASLQNESDNPTSRYSTKTNVITSTQNSLNKYLQHQVRNSSVHGIAKWYIYTMECHTKIKGIKLPTHATDSDVPQMRGARGRKPNCMNPPAGHSGKGSTKGKRYESFIIHADVFPQMMKTLKQQNIPAIMFQGQATYLRQDGHLVLKYKNQIPWRDRRGSTYFGGLLALRSFLLFGMNSGL